MAPRIDLASRLYAVGENRQDQLLEVQALMAKGDERAAKIFQTIGIYLGYTLAHYAQFYALTNVLILGRVTSGEGGNIEMAEANRVLTEEFPELAKTLSVQLPDEKARRVGQSIAAASLPEL